MPIKTKLRLGQISGSLGHTAATSAFKFGTGAGAAEVSYLNFDTQNGKLELGDSTVEIQLDGNIEGSAFLNENNMASNSATKLASQASIKAYVDSVAQGLAVKESVLLATTADLATSGGSKAYTYAAGSGGSGGTITKDSTGYDQIDGELPKLNDRILVKNQSQQHTNGIYAVTTVGQPNIAGTIELGFGAGIPANNETLQLDFKGASNQVITFRGGVAPGSSDSSFSGNAADIGIQGGNANDIATAVRALFNSLANYSGGGSGDIASAVGNTANDASFNVTRDSGSDTMGDGGSSPQVDIINASAAAQQVLTRAVDADGNAQNGNAELGPGSFCFVTMGTANADKGFVMTGNQALPANNTNTNITFTQFSSVGAITGGEGISVSSSVVSLDINGLSNTMASGDIAVGDLMPIYDTDQSRVEKMSIESLLDKFGGTGLSRSGASLAVDASQAISALTAGDLTIYDDNNNADVSLSMGTGASEALVIEVLNGGANKDAESVRFTSKTANNGANKGKFEFFVDEAQIVEIVDGGLDFASAKSIAIAGTEILSATQLSVPRAVLDGDHQYGNGDGSVLHIDTGTLTDSATGASNTIARAAAVVFEGPTLAAQNSSVTTTDAATVYISAAPSAGSNQTLTRAYALWADAGKVRIDGGIMAGTTDIINGSGEILVAAQPNITSLGTLSSAQITSLELGHASDTTITRASAGVLAVEGQKLGMKTFKEHFDVTAVGGLPANNNAALPTSADDGINFNVRFTAAAEDDREVYVNGQLLKEGSAGNDDWYEQDASNIRFNFALEVGDLIQMVVRHKGS